jgi:hypothetical protein
VEVTNKSFVNQSGNVVVDPSFVYVHLSAKFRVADSIRDNGPTHFWATFLTCAALESTLGTNSVSCHHLSTFRLIVDIPPIVDLGFFGPPVPARSFVLHHPVPPCSAHPPLGKKWGDLR